VVITLTQDENQTKDMDTWTCTSIHNSLERREPCQSAITVQILPKQLHIRVWLLSCNSQVCVYLHSLSWFNLNSRKRGEVSGKGSLAMTCWLRHRAKTVKQGKRPKTKQQKPPPTSLVTRSALHLVRCRRSHHFPDPPPIHPLLHTCQLLESVAATAPACAREEAVAPMSRQSAQKALGICEGPAGPAGK